MYAEPRTTIRHPNDSEYDEIHALVCGVVEEVLGKSVAKTVTLDRSQLPQAAWVVVDQAKIIGVLITDKDWIDDLWVLREHRGHGIGRQLLTKAEEEIGERGYRVMRLRVAIENSQAVSFYGKNGWTIERECPHETLTITMLEMSKKIQR